MTWDPSQATDERDEGPDTRVVPLVESLNAHGLATLASCSGHPPEGGTGYPGYVMLTPESVTDDQAQVIASDPAVWWVHKPDAFLVGEFWHIAWLAENADAAMAAVHRALVSDSGHPQMPSEKVPR